MSQDDKRGSLTEKLTEYSGQNVIPMHMPGHKRHTDGFFDWYAEDITEIDDFDNLHDATGILKVAMDRAARLLGAKRTWFLVNGSTCGILAAIFAATKPGDAVLVARNCHKAVYNALCLRGLKPVYLYPELDSWGYPLALTKEQVETALTEHAEDYMCSHVQSRIQSHTKIRAMILTSPTYEGVVSEVRGICTLCHEWDVTVIVDEAHGAHLPFRTSEFFPESAISAGADLVIESVHKTLPAPTQTAVLSVTGSRVEAERIEHFLGVFETSSPSYPLMAGIDRCMEWMEDNGGAAMERYTQMLSKLYETSKQWQYVEVKEAAGRDPGKVLVRLSKLGMTGREIYDILKNRFCIQPEMATEGYCLLMTSLMDTEKSFAVLIKALETLDREAEEKEGEPAFGEPFEIAFGEPFVSPYIQESPECPLSMSEAFEAERCLVPVGKLTGAEICAEWIVPYPPGIPVLVPGERIAGHLPWLREHREQVEICVEIPTGK